MKFLAISALALGLFVPQVEVSAKQIITQAKREHIGHPLVAMPMTMGLLAARPSATRATLISTEVFTTSTAITGWSKSLTVPANCNLLIVTVASRHSASASTVTVNFNGSAMTAVTAWSQDGGNRTGAGIYRVTNPATGTKTLAATFSAVATGTMVAHYFIGNTTTPTANASHQGSAGATSLSASFVPATSKPYIVACCSHRSSSTPSWSYTNLTQSNVFDNTASGQNAFATGVNSTLTEAGSTTFTMTETAGGSQAMSMAICEVRQL